MLKFFALLIFLCAALNSIAAQTSPEPEREFRAAWVATVDNIDFPSRKNLSVAEQKAEMIRILETLRELKFNCIVFQIRPHADAFYKSKFEPWSEYLTGEMGKSPQPFYDPLAFTIEEAHKRGILVHAWFNPYRAYHPAAKTVSPNHISKTRPDLVRSYGKYLWLDPTDAEVQKLSSDVILDVVRRYDVDGVHFDDYFYPYPERDAAGNKIEFPDAENYEKYKKTANRVLPRDDWRRSQVNNFIESLAKNIKRVKPEVMFGISPFGIWKPFPEQGINGFNAHDELYADARKWLQEGTVDYLAPQLYWETAREGQSFPVLLRWWNEQNIRRRHLWVGIAPYRVGSNANFTAQEIANQIETARRLSPETRGIIHFSMKHLAKNTGGVADILRQKVYRRNAVIPESDWIKAQKPLAPAISLKKQRDKFSISWRERGARRAFWFVVYALDQNGWSQSVVPAVQTSLSLSTNRKIRQIRVSSVDRLGNESKSEIKIVNF